MPPMLDGLHDSMLVAMVITCGCGAMLHVMLVVCTRKATSIKKAPQSTKAAKGGSSSSRRKNVKFKEAHNMVVTAEQAILPKTYKPGHLPEFADLDDKQNDTFYGLKSAIAFPLKNSDGTLAADRGETLVAPVVLPQAQQIAKPHQPTRPAAPTPPTAVAAACPPLPPLQATPQSTADVAACPPLPDLDVAACPPLPDVAPVCPPLPAVPNVTPCPSLPIVQQAPPPPPQQQQQQQEACPPLSPFQQPCPTLPPPRQDSRRASIKESKKSVAKPAAAPPPYNELGGMTYAAPNMQTNNSAYALPK